MRMRAIPALDVTAGKPVGLKPGSYHGMLMELKAPLEKGTNVPLTLVFQDAKGVQSQLQLQVPVTDQPAAAKMQHKNAEHSH
jgi:copper(I)-binding protein